MVLRSLHLCSGYGGFELALRIAGVDSRTVAHVERDAYAASILVARMEDARLDPAPIWSDIHTFDGGPWRGRVDLITAGFPCQPWSAAGQRRGLDDDRWLWPEIARLIGEVRPGLVFLENVPGLNRAGDEGGGLPHVLQDLADLGFDAEWGLLAASGVGAPHKRERWWLVAVAHDDVDRLQTIWREVRREPVGDEHAWDVVDGPSGSALGDAGCTGRPEDARGAPGDEGTDGRRPQGDHIAVGADEGMGDAEVTRLEGIPGRGVQQPQLTGSAEPGGPGLADAACIGRRREGFGPATQERSSWLADVQTGGIGAWPPLPDDTDAWAEWISAGGPEPSVRRSTDGPPVGLADALHLGGNGLVPQCAAHAFIHLTERLVAARVPD